MRRIILKLRILLYVFVIYNLYYFTQEYNFEIIHFMRNIYSMYINILIVYEEIVEQKSLNENE